MSDFGDYEDAFDGGDEFYDDGDFAGQEDMSPALVDDDEDEDGGGEEDEDFDDILVNEAAGAGGSGGGGEAAYSTNLPVRVTYVEGTDRTTLSFMTKYEYASAIAYRAQQIEDGAEVNPKVVEAASMNPDILTHSLDIAKYELDHHQADFPNVIFRPIFDDPKRKVYEKWLVSELTIPRDILCSTTTGASGINSNCSNTKRIEFDAKAREFAMLRHYT